MKTRFCAAALTQQATVRMMETLQMTAVDAIDEIMKNLHIYPEIWGLSPVQAHAVFTEIDVLRTQYE